MLLEWKMKTMLSYRVISIKDLKARVQAHTESLLWSCRIHTLLFNQWNSFNHFHILSCNTFWGKFAGG